MSDIENGATHTKDYGAPSHQNDYGVELKHVNASKLPPANPTWEYMEREEKVHGFLSKQFPTLANPAPLGLCGFALTTFILSMFNAGAVGNDLHRPSSGVVMGMAMFYGGLVQLLAGMWEVKTGNTFGAVAFASYGGFWMGFAALSVKAFGFLDGYGTDHVQLDNDLAVFLLAWSIFSLLMTIAAHRTTLVLFVLFFMVFLTFLFLAMHHFCHVKYLVLQQTGGAFGLIAAFIAWYAAFAGLLTDKQSLFRLPVWDMDPIWRHFGFLPAEVDNHAK